MYLYCITPYDKIESNFIKVGICENISIQKNRYNTYYGESCRYHYVEVDDKSYENIIHNELKNIGVHLENELFLYNKKYDFFFYTQILENIRKSANISILSNTFQDKNYVHKQRHMFDFIVDTFLKISKKEGIKSTFTNEIIISYNNKNDIEKLWLYYLAFCIKNKQIYKSKNVLKNNIQSMIHYEGPEKHENYKIQINVNEIIVTNMNKEVYNKSSF